MIIDVQQEQTLPEGVQSFFLLNAANVSEENERLARATCGDFTYKNMKSTIQKIFGDPSATTCDIAPAIKVEPAFVSEHQSRGRFSNRSTWRGRGRGRGTFRGNTNTNPLDREGNI